MPSQKHASELHNEINGWRSLIELVRDETRTFTKELSEVSSKNTDGVIRPLIAHFESQFIRQNEVSDELYHELKLADHHLAGIIRENPAADHVLVDDHEILRTKAQVYEKLFTELKDAYRAFLSKWM